MRRLVFALVSSFLLFAGSTGCMYPDEQRRDRQMSARDSLVLVQAAVDQFREDNGLLPIRNFDESTPQYQRYRVDLEKLLRMNYLGSLPPAAFENGGTHYFVLIDVEENPTVKLMDLVTIQKVGEIEKAVQAHRQERNELPLGTPAAPGWYHLDGEALGNENIQVKSVFSGRYTGVLIHESGALAVNYAPDIMTLIQREGISDIHPETDLREYLLEYSYYVPVKSYPYYWRNGEPLISEP